MTHFEVEKTDKISTVVLGIGKGLQARLELHGIGTVGEWCGASLDAAFAVQRLGPALVARIDERLIAAGFSPPGR